jgi:NADPH-dependent 2,4-dienoyl-CoA reductase/sulfur reductase-like enzyme
LVTGIIGGGFIGSEIAASLTSIGEKVLMIFPEDGIGARIFPKELSRFVTGYYQDKGVEVRTGLEISSIEKKGDRFMMGTNAGSALQVDRLIAGIGLLPNTDLAESAGVTMAGAEGGKGIRVDDHLRTNLPDIFAAGDVASFRTSALRREMRVEHEDNANTMGRIAGLNMAGVETVYDYLPYFYSDLFDLGYEAIGELDPGMDVIQDWKELYRKGVLYYMKDQRVVGVLLWNTWDQINPARGLIASGQVFQNEDLLGRLGN